MNAIGCILLRQDQEEKTEEQGEEDVKPAAKTMNATNRSALFDIL